MNKLLEFKNYLKALGYSENTIKAYTRDIKPYVNGNLDEFIKSLANLKENSRYRKVCALKKFLAFRNENINLPKVKFINNPRRYKLVSYNEVLNAIRRIENKQVKFILLLMLKLGLRVSEAISVKKEDFVDNYLIVKGKGGYEYKLLVDDEIKELIDDYKSISRISVYRWCKKFLNLYPHNLRALFITEIAKKDLNIARILARHKNIQTTTRYIIPDENRIKGILKEVWKGK